MSTKGYRHTAEAKAKTAATHRGRKQQPEWIKKRTESRLKTIRERGHYYKGGKKTPHIYTAEERRASSERLKRHLEEHPEHLEKLRVAANQPKGPLPEYRRKQISELHKGKKLSEDHKRKLAIVRARNHAENPNYGKRGWRKENPLTPRIHLIRCSVEMAKWRNIVFARDDYTCRLCGVKGGKLNAHHMLSFKKFPQFRFSAWNGATLHVTCHRRVHDLMRADYRDSLLKR